MLPKISISIPVFNEEGRIGSCLENIFSQEYPLEAIEVLIADGASTDRTKEIAKKYPVKIFDNPRRLCDYGEKINVSHATGELLIRYAADNKLHEKDWLKVMGHLFMSHPGLCAAWCPQIAHPEDPFINRYYELIQNDPLSFFINQNISTYLNSTPTQQILNKQVHFFTVHPRRPLIWGANGLTYRLKHVKAITLREAFICDNDIFQCMLEEGNTHVAYVTDLHVVHHHLKSLKTWMTKWKRNYSKHFLANYQTRNLNWAILPFFKLKVCMWVVYSLLPVFSITHTMYLLGKTQKLAWIYHPVANFVQCLFYLYSTLTRKSGWMFIRSLFLSPAKS